MKPPLLKYLSVGIGGMIGASLRYGVGTWMESGNANLFPWETLTVNITGAFLLSFLLFYPPVKEKISPLILPGITTGLLGSYTTFSTLSVEIVQLFDHHTTLAVVYMLTSFIIGLAASFAGYKTAQS